MTILGIDPGTVKVGFGIIEVDNKNNLHFKKCGTFNFKDKKPEERLLSIFKKITKLLKDEKPELVALEKVFFARNKKTALAISEARGVISVAVGQKGIPLVQFTPLQVKQAVSTSGAADKKEVQKMVRLLLNLPSDPEPYDAADALALAICSAQSNNWTDKIK